MLGSYQYDYKNIEKPRDAYKLSDVDLRRELILRNITDVDFVDDQRRVLQRYFDDEFVEIKTNYEKIVREALEKERHEKEELLKMLLEEKEVKKEKLALAADKKTSDLIDDLVNNQSPPEVIIRIEPVLLRPISRAIEFNKTLKSLDICRSGLNDYYCTYLFRSLHNNQTLEKLELANNKIGSESMSILADSLTANRTIININIQGNPLCDSNPDGFVKFCHQLKDMISLRYLNLCGTGIDNIAGNHLVRGMSQNRHITNLELNNNFLFQHQLNEISQYLDRNRNIYSKRLMDSRIERRETREQEMKLLAERNEQKRIEDEESWINEQIRIREEERVAAKKAELKRIEDQMYKIEEDKKNEEEERKRLEAERKKKRRKERLAAKKKKK